MTCKDCGVTWTDGRTVCDHRIYDEDAGKYTLPADAPMEMAEDVPMGYVPSLADFEDLHATMDRQREVTVLVDGEIMRGRQVGAQFVPTDKEGLRAALEGNRETLDAVRIPSSER